MSAGDANRARVFTLNARLDQFFPPEHPDSPWMLRLAILRDDVAYEMDLISLTPEAPPAVIWKCGYAFRKLAITIGEIKNIFTKEVSDKLRARERHLPPSLVSAFRDAARSIEEAAAILLPLRDGLGAHVRPSYAAQTSPKVDPTPEVIRSHGATECHLCLDMETGRKTVLHTLTASAFLFAWPDVVDDDDFKRKTSEVLARLGEAASPILHGIDMLLYLHWEGLGIPFDVEGDHGRSP